MSEARRLKVSGVEPGVPDLFCPAWMLWIEMKREKGGTVSKPQKDWHAYLNECGYTVVVARGWDDAINQVSAMFDVSAVKQL